MYTRHGFWLQFHDTMPVQLLHFEYDLCLLSINPWPVDESLPGFRWWDQLNWGRISQSSKSGYHKNNRLTWICEPKRRCDDAGLSDGLSVVVLSCSHFSLHLMATTKTGIHFHFWKTSILFEKTKTHKSTTGTAVTSQERTQWPRLSSSLSFYTFKLLSSPDRYCRSSSTLVLDMQTDWRNHLSISTFSCNAC